ncbi:putative ataxin-3 -like protein [Capsicum chinense]|nr:putative ataxin-3 -like protein [Capsicum chinense]
MQFTYFVQLCTITAAKVLQKALEVWDLQIIPLDSPVAEPAQIDPELENAFICHLLNHWFCIRKVNGEWYNFDSLKAAPEHLSKFYLSAYLDSLKGFGWSIFLVRGKFPKECPMSSSEASSGFGQWLLPEDAERITKSCSAAQSTGSRSGQSQWPSDPYHQYEQQGTSLLDQEDEDLKAAIAASLMDASHAVSSKPDDALENENKDNSAANA